jgi:competence protein ComEC
VLHTRILRNVVIPLLVLLLFTGCIPTRTSTLTNTVTQTVTQAQVVIVIPTAGQPTSVTTTTSSTTSQPSSKDTLAVYFIDVGQGDAIFIDLGTTEILIDGGDRTPGVVDFLKQYVQGDLEVIIATHPHADHIGGLMDVLAGFKVDQIWYNGESSTSKTYSDFMNAVQAESAQVHIGKRGDKINAGSLMLTILNPFDSSGTTNNNSIVTELDYGNVDFLF